MISVRYPRRVSDYRWKYPRQFDYQQAFIELDPEERMLSADFNGEIGNAVPAAVYHRRLLRWSIPSSLKLREVREIMNAVRPLCEELCEGYDTMRNGSNFAGRFDYELDERIEFIIADNVRRMLNHGI